MFVRVPMSWDDIDALRTFVQGCVGDYCGGSAATRAALVAHELLENALRYGSMEREIALEVHVVPNTDRFEVQVGNDVSTSRMELLRAAVLRASRGDAVASYTEAVARSRECFGTSGIGLARIRRDAQVAVALLVRDNWVTVSARSA